MTKAQKQMFLVWRELPFGALSAGAVAHEPMRRHIAHHHSCRTPPDCENAADKCSESAPSPAATLGKSVILQCAKTAVGGINAGE